MDNLRITLRLPARMIPLERVNTEDRTGLGEMTSSMLYLCNVGKLARNY